MNDDNRTDHLHSVRPPAQDLLDRGEVLLLAVILSLLVHGMLLVVARGVPITTGDQLAKNTETLFRVRVRDEDQRYMRAIKTVGPERVQQMKEVLTQRMDELTARDPQAQAPQDPSPGMLDPLKLDVPRGPIADELGSDLQGGGWEPQDGGGAPDDILRDPLASAPDAGMRTLRPPRTRPDVEREINIPPVPVAAPTFVVPPPRQDILIEPQVATPAPLVRAEPTVELEVPDPIAPDVREIQDDIGRRIEAKGYRAIDDYLSIELDTYHMPGDPVGFFRLRFTPNSASDRLRVMRKDVAFVLDCSRSMGSHGFAAAKEGLRESVLNLHPGDRFNVIGFRRDVLQFTQGLVAADRGAMGQALRYIDDLGHSGRTDIYESLIPISQVGGSENHPFIVFLISDGKPTFGVTDSRTIINEVTRRIQPNSSIFAAGVGQRQNRYLLDLLARRNKGFTVFSPDLQATAGTIESAFATVSDPLLINVQVDFADADIAPGIYPRRLPDLYRAGSIDIYGRYTDQDQLTFRFTGRFEQEPQDAVIQQAFPATDTPDASIAANWARNKAYEIIGKICEEGETTARQNALRQLSSTYDLNIPHLE